MEIGNNAGRSAGLGSVVWDHHNYNNKFGSFDCQTTQFLQLQGNVITVKVAIVGLYNFFVHF